jgi:hypothetical protein
MSCDAMHAEPEGEIKKVVTILLPRLQTTFPALAVWKLWSQTTAAYCKRNNHRPVGDFGEGDNYYHLSLNARAKLLSFFALPVAFGHLFPSPSTSLNELWTAVLHHHRYLGLLWQREISFSEIQTMQEEFLQCKRWQGHHVKYDHAYSGCSSCLH